VTCTTPQWKKQPYAGTTAFDHSSGGGGSGSGSISSSAAAADELLSMEGWKQAPYASRWHVQQMAWTGPPRGVAGPGELPVVPQSSCHPSACAMRQQQIPHWKSR